MEGIIGNNNNNNNGEKGGIMISGNKKRIENPFSFKVLQVFTGFGIGCGLGIGVGHPINLGAIPMLGKVMVAARGATDAFSGVTRHVNQSLKRYGPKFGPKNIEAGIGCGVGFGHGFGVGLAVKPGVLHQAQLYILETMGKMITKFGIAPNLSNFQGNLPASLQSGIPMLSNSTNQNQIGSIMGLTEKVPNNSSQGLSQVANSQIVSATETFASQPLPLNTQYESRTKKVINNFLQSPILKGEDSGPDELLRDTAERLRSENNVLQLVLKHQQLIEELMEENMKLRQILVEDLKVPPGKLKAGSSTNSTECFECRRKQRRR